MNLHAIAGPVVAAVNPMVAVAWYRSSGYVTANDGSRVPDYESPVVFPGQIQALTYTDLRQVDGLNIVGVRRAIYLLGNITSIIRTASKGEDLIVTPDGSVWLVAYALETWEESVLGQSGWCKVVVTLQTDMSPPPIYLESDNAIMTLTSDDGLAFLLPDFAQSSLYLSSDDNSLSLRTDLGTQFLTST